MKKLLLVLTFVLTYSFSSACNAFFTHTYACAGDTVFFQALDQFGVYTWDFGDTTSGAANVSHDTATWHVYNTPGTYFVTLFVNIGAEWDYRSQFITIGTDCFDAAFSTECSSDSTLLFNNESTGDYTSVSWDFGDTASAANHDTTLNPFHTFSAPGTYTVTLVTSDGTNSDTSSQQVIVSGGCISANFYNFLGGNCVQDTTHITVFYGGNPTAYLWNFGDPASGISNISTDSAGSHQYSVPGTYLITLIVSNAFETDTFYNIQNIIDCNVWPGNVNTDGRVNMEDLFAIGIYYGDTGTIRPMISNSWTGFQSANWSTSFDMMYLQDLIDKKHADCNGDGVINALDISAIDQNYDSILPNYPHNDLIQMMPVTANDPVLEVATPLSYQGATNVSLPINLSAIDSVRNVYGIASRIYYDPALVVPGSVNVTFNNSWLGTSNVDMLALYKDFSSAGYVDFGIVRTDKITKTGNGTIAYLNFTLTQVSGMMDIEIDPVIRLIKNGSFSTNQEVFLPVSGINSQFNFINVSVEENENSLAGVYPNPAKDFITIHSLKSEISRVVITDVTGKEVLVRECYSHASSVVIDCRELSAGIYFVNVMTNKGMSKKKFVVQD